MRAHAELRFVDSANVSDALANLDGIASRSGRLAAAIGSACKEEQETEAAIHAHRIAHDTHESLLASGCVRTERTLFIYPAAHAVEESSKVPLTKK